MVTFQPGDVLLAEGATSGHLFVLIEGEVEIWKGDFRINRVSDAGAILGDMSVLLGIPHMATVRARSACSAYVTEAGNEFLQSQPEITFQLAKMLAQRLHGVTTYLADLKAQFEDEASHLGIVDEILETLVHQQRPTFTPGSDRDPG